MNRFFRRYRQHFQGTLRLTWPVVVGQIGHIAIGLADNAIIGRLSPAHLGAASIANAIFFLILVLGMGVTLALTPLVAEADAEKDVERSAHLFNQGFWVNLGIGIVLFAACYGMTYLIPLLDQPPNVVELSVPYLRILSITIIPSMIFMTYKQFIEGLSIMRPAMWAMIVVVLLNVGLNWVFVFGKFGFPELGLNGAGWATLIARVAGMVILFVIVVHDNELRIYQPWPRVVKLGSKVARKILSIGLPSSLQYFFEVGAFAGAVIIVGWLGEEAPLAAHQLAIHMASISYSIAMGISSAAAIRVANAVGKRKGRDTRMAGFSAIFMGIAFMGLCALGFVLGKDVLPLIYTDDQEVIRITSVLLLMAAMFQVSDGIQAIAVGALRGISDVKVPAAITFIAYWVLGLPIGYLFGIQLGMGAVGVWIGISIGLTFSAVFLTLRFARATRLRQS